jgi:hypothetical protein
MAEQQTAKRSPSNIPLIICIIIFLVSSLLAAMFLKLDRHIEKTSAKVTETYTKKAFVSRKQSYEKEYLVVTYSVNGKEYTKKTARHNGYGEEYVPVFYYAGHPEFAWFYKKGNANIVYCCTAMALSLIVSVMMLSNRRKAKIEDESGRKKR